MTNFKIIFGATVLAVSMALPAAVQAELLKNSWDPIDVIVPSQGTCGNADFFHLEGVVHEKISTLRNGNWAVNVNVMGTFTPLTGQEEEGAIFRQNIHNVLPILGENLVHNVGDTIKIIGRPNGENYRANFNYHVTDLGGEIKSSFVIDKVSCW